MIPKKVNRGDEEEGVKMRLNDGNLSVQYKKRRSYRLAYIRKAVN